MKQLFTIQNWNVWPPLGKEVDEALLQKQLLLTLPRMLRRRLTPLARAVFSAAIPCVDKNSAIPIVFSSTHGELAKSFKMMEMLEAGEEISPTAFSLSVHNAIAGLFSIAFNNRTECTVVAPGEEGIAAAFIEAIGLLEEGKEQVLLVLYDEPLVAFYPSAPYKLSAEQSCTIALTVSKGGEGVAIQLSCEHTTGDDGEQPLQVPLLIEFLANRQNKLTIHNPRHSWRWQK